MSDWGYDITRLVRTSRAERYWFEGHVSTAEMRDTRPWMWRSGSGRGCHGARYEKEPA